MGKTIDGTYYSDEQIDKIKKAVSSDDFDKFLISGVIGAVTGSGLLGGLLGGDLIGGILGDAMTGDDDSWLF